MKEELQIFRDDQGDFRYFRFKSGVLNQYPEVLEVEKDYLTTVTRFPQPDHRIDSKEALIQSLLEQGYKLVQTREQVL